MLFPGEIAQCTVQYANTWNKTKRRAPTHWGAILISPLHRVLVALIPCTVAPRPLWALRIQLLLTCGWHQTNLLTSVHRRRQKTCPRVVNCFQPFFFYIVTKKHAAHQLSQWAMWSYKKVSSKLGRPRSSGRSTAPQPALQALRYVKVSLGKTPNPKCVGVPLYSILDIPFRIMSNIHKPTVY